MGKKIDDMDQSIAVFTNALYNMEAEQEAREARDEGGLGAFFLLLAPMWFCMAILGFVARFVWKLRSVVRR